MPDEIKLQTLLELNYYLATRRMYFYLICRRNESLSLKTILFTGMRSNYIVCNRFIIICDCIIVRRHVLKKRPDYELCVLSEKNISCCLKPLIQVNIPVSMFFGLRKNVALNTEQ